MATSAQVAHAAIVINVPADQPTIQAGINAASSGDTVVVAPGTYFEHVNFNGKAIEVKSSAGAASTILDGSSSGAVVTMNSSETASSILRGFTIQHGGPGILIANDSSPVITGNTVTENTSRGIAVFGGALTITNNTISGNTSCGGGAGIDTWHAAPLIQNNVIVNNTDPCIGGALGGGGIRLQAPDTTQIIGNTIDGNHVDHGVGGGIFILGGSNSVTVTNNLVRGNTASQGGAFGYDTFDNSAATTTNALTFVQNVFGGNTASQAGGAYFNFQKNLFTHPGTVAFTSNTIGNTTTGGGKGVVLVGSYSGSAFANNIVTEGVSCDATDGSTVPTFDANNITAYDGSCAGTTGTDGNISADPHFLDAPNGDYRLQFASPSVDAGDNAAPSLPSTDLDGNPRIVGGVVDQGAYEYTPTAAVPTGEYTSLTPSRVLDTRDGTGGHLGALGADASFDVQITGNGGVPLTGVSAVVLNATVTGPTKSSFLTIWPTGVTRPFISNLNYVPGQTVPNLVTVKVGGGGKVSVYNNQGSTDVVFDVVGFYSDATGPFGSRFHGLTPFRDFDTRNGTGGVPNAPLGPGGVLGFDVTGKGGVPASGVTGVVMNVTVTEPTSASHLTVYPDDVARPLASNLNYVPGSTVPNLVIMRVPPTGIVDFYNNSGAVHVIADVVGYYDNDKTTEGGRFVPVTPFRRADTRVSSPFPAPGKILPGFALLLRFPGYPGLPASGIGSMVMNVTVTEPDTASYVTVFPADAALPFASNLNFVPGQTVPNLVIAKVSSGPPPSPAPQSPGWIGYFNSSGSTHLVVDVFGYFTASFTDVNGSSITPDSGPDAAALPINGG